MNKQTLATLVGLFALGSMTAALASEPTPAKDEKTAPKDDKKTDSAPKGQDGKGPAPAGDKK